MTNKNEVVKQEPKSIIAEMASKFNMERAAFESIMKQTVMPANKTVSNEEFVAFLSVASEYDLNPLSKEIFAFPAKGGGIQAVVSIDGWLKIINNHPQMDGLTLTENFDTNDKLISTTCKIHRKDRSQPIEMTEYLSECKMNTDPWNKKPVRMLRHKATIQCGRYAFGITKVMDEDDYAQMKDVSPQKNDKLKEGFLNNAPSSNTFEKDGLGSLFAQEAKAEPEKQPLLEAIEEAEDDQDIFDRAADEIVKKVVKCQTIDELNKVVEENKQHEEALPDLQAIKVGEEIKNKRKKLTEN